jgi:hypothetical protein
MGDAPSSRWIGRRIRVVSLPPLDDMAPETVAAVRWTLGREYTVKGVGRYGHLELLLGPEADRVLGSFMNTVWIEPEHIVEVEPTAGGSDGDDGDGDRDADGDGDGDGHGNGDGDGDGDGGGGGDIRGDDDDISNGGDGEHGPG